MGRQESSQSGICGASICFFPIIHCTVPSSFSQALAQFRGLLHYGGEHPVFPLEKRRNEKKGHKRMGNGTFHADDERTILHLEAFVMVFGQLKETTLKRRVSHVFIYVDRCHLLGKHVPSQYNLHVDSNVQ